MAPFNHFERNKRLQASAATYTDVAIESATREYPHFPIFIATEPASYQTHREYHPAFYGSFDWHSCVEMHWVVARLSRLFSEKVPQEKMCRFFDHLLTSEHLNAEQEFFRAPANRSLERPYGWGWFLRLAHELEFWDHPKAGQWLAAVKPLADFLMVRLLEWLPKLIYPQRVGNHPNTAFSLSNALEFSGPAEREQIEVAARRYFINDTNYPLHYEPSGADFLSAGLCEAELMAKILDPDEFIRWFEKFLPDLVNGEPENIMQPAIVTDMTDGQLAHLHGLNLSRAWCFVRLAAALPENDPRIPIMLNAADRHANASMSFVSGSDYMVEHWLAAYATLLLSE